MDLASFTMSSQLTPIAESSPGKPGFSYEPVRNETVEKFIALCRSRLVDTPNRRKKRFSCLRKHVSRYSQSRLWNRTTFDGLIAKFSNLMVNEMVPAQASVILDGLISELQNLTGRNCSKKVCHKKANKQKIKRVITVAKLEKSLASVQRRISRLKGESSSSTAWQARDGRCLKLHGLQKRALRLTKKINEMNNNASHNQLIGQVEDVPGNAVSKRIGTPGKDDLAELETLLKSVRLRDSVKISKLLRLGESRWFSLHKPRYEMVEIKKYDQRPEKIVQPGENDGNGNSIKPLPLNGSSRSVHLIRNSIESLDKSFDSQYPVDPSQTSQTQVNQPDYIPKPFNIDIVCDRLDHVTLDAS